MIVEVFSIVKLYKPKYNSGMVKERDGATPRLLVLRTHQDTQQCTVRYPNGYIQRVPYSDITERSTFTKDHISYPKILSEMYAAQIELDNNPMFRTFLEHNFPKECAELSQKVYARHQRWNKDNKTNPAPTSDKPLIMQRPTQEAIIQTLDALPDYANTTVLPATLPPLQNETPVVMDDMKTCICLLNDINSKLNTLIELWGGSYNANDAH